MEIVAIALVRYQAVLRQAGSDFHDLFRVLAWIEVILATLVSGMVLVRFTIFGARAVVARAQGTQAKPVQSAAAAHVEIAKASEPASALPVDLQSSAV